MAPRKSNAQKKSSSATAIAETAEKTVPEVAQQETTATAVASDPSGKSVPDGTNSNGDAAGDNGAAPENANGTASASQSVEAASGVTASASDSSEGGSEANSGQEKAIVFGFDLGSSDTSLVSWGSFQGTEKEFVAAFPNLHAIFMSLSEDENSTAITKISVRAHKDSYRRGGLKHTKAGQEFLIKDLNPQQLEDMLADPRTKVEFI